MKKKKKKLTGFQRLAQIGGRAARKKLGREHYVKIAKKRWAKEKKKKK